MTFRRYRWRGPQPACAEEQIANAPDDYAALTPASTAPADRQKANWAAAQRGGVPFVWDRDVVDLPPPYLDDFPPVNKET
ncbi:MAG TPA: hypothetical protein VFJ19_09365 [Nocardioidaceae bacterium]|nr:hypothetical protein [Nocardioidaceae bacterium]